jgi:hypothetical protein
MWISGPQSRIQNIDVDPEISVIARMIQAIIGGFE